MVALLGALAAAGCSGPADARAEPFGPVSAQGVFRLPRSACELADTAAVARLAGRAQVVARSVTMTQQKAGQTFLSCAFTAGFVPVGALTLGVRAGGRGVSARQELDDSVASSEYGRGDVEDIAGLGDAARYGVTPSLAGTTFASIWVVRVRGGELLDLSVTSAARVPGTARDPMVALARAALDRL
jgi:hypothetical protein